MLQRNKPTWYVKKDDTRPHLDVILTDDQLRPLDVSNSAVTFTMRDASSGDVTVDAARCLFLNPSEGAVRHRWTAAQTSMSGLYEGEFRVEDDSGRVQTFPSDGFISIIIVDSI